MVEHHQFSWQDEITNQCLHVQTVGVLWTEMLISCTTMSIYWLHEVACLCPSHSEQVKHATISCCLMQSAINVVRWTLQASHKSFTAINTTQCILYFRVEAYLV